MQRKNRASVFKQQQQQKLYFSLVHSFLWTTEHG